MNEFYTEAAYEQAIEDYDALLAAREPDSLVEKWRATHEYFEISPAESGLDPVLVQTLVRLGLRPLVATNSTFAGGAQIRTEDWGASDGATTIKFGHGPPMTGPYISSYFSDATAITIWPSGTDLARHKHERRTNLLASGDFAADVSRALDLCAKRSTSDVRPLLRVDVRTLDLASEVCARYFATGGFAAAMAAASPDAMRRSMLGLFLKLYLAALAVVAMLIWLFGPTQLLVVAAITIVVVAATHTIDVWRRRGERFPSTTHPRPDIEALLNPRDL